jgi:transcription elongation GreA/GreB family factor
MPERFFLQPDLESLDSQITLMQSRIRAVKLEAQEGTEQSSESWHDNYVFEESQRQLKMLLNLLGGLSSARENAVVVHPPTDPQTVEVGTTVEFLLDGNLDVISIGSYMVSDSLRDRDFVSYEAPLAVCLLGLKPGETRLADLHGRAVRVEICSVTSASL